MSHKIRSFFGRNFLNQLNITPEYFPFTRRFISKRYPRQKKSVLLMMVEVSECYI